jgi:hypothetical protein
LPFDQNFQYIRPHNWQGDKLRGIGADATRFDEEQDDVKQALTELMNIVRNLTGSTFQPAFYYSRTQIDQMLAQKQAKLNYVPIDLNTRGQANGVAPLGVDGRLGVEFFPPGLGGGVATGLSSFMGRTTSAAALTANDISTVLGFLPEAPGANKTIAQVIGLQAALDAKGPSLGYTAADEASVASRLTAMDTAKQAALTNPVTFSTATAAATTDLPNGSIVLVDAGGTPISKREQKVIYTGLLDTDSYNIAGAGTALVGTWRCAGMIGSNALFQRVST